MKYNNETLGAIALIFAGIFLSFGGVIIKYMESASAWCRSGIVCDGVGRRCRGRRPVVLCFRRAILLLVRFPRSVGKGDH